MLSLLKLVAIAFGLWVIGRVLIALIEFVCLFGRIGFRASLTRLLSQSRLASLALGFGFGNGFFPLRIVDSLLFLGGRMFAAS